ncbi:hypothetical protein DI43_05945 [Geobacillus sp. CAMR12739]|nr:hypothetical protein DI43_05945 [Geobacillus sp. CAMR12739]
MGNVDITASMRKPQAIQPLIQFRLMKQIADQRQTGIGSERLIRQYQTNREVFHDFTCLVKNHGSCLSLSYQRFAGIVKMFGHGFR